MEFTSKFDPAVLRCLTGARAIAGITLVEILVTVAAISFLAALALPSIWEVAESASRQTALRNAQTIAVVSTVMLAAGDTRIDEAASLEQAVEIVRAGVTGAPGLSGATFQVTSMSDEDVAAALPYLELQGSTIVLRRGP